MPASRTSVRNAVSTEDGDANDEYLYDDAYDSTLALSRAPNENFKAWRT